MEQQHPWPVLMTSALRRNNQQPGWRKKESAYEEQNNPATDWPTLQRTVQPYDELAHSTMNTMTLQ